MWAVVSLGVSVFGLVSLFSFKQWELRHGMVTAAALRSRFDAKLVALAARARGLPQQLMMLSRMLMRQWIFHVSAVLLRFVRLAEQRLIRIINLVKGKGELKRTGEASSFLRDIASYKQPPQA